MKRTLTTLLSLALLGGQTLVQATLQRVPNMVVYSPDTAWDNSTAGTMDAAGESVAIIGHVALENGNAATKTCSSSGCKLYQRIGTPITFGNAGTNIRIGIQDVSATTGLEDGVYDVQADLVGLTDTITANTYRLTAMESGSKTITQGDVIAIVVEMTARGGASDSIVLNRFLPPNAMVDGFPYGTADTGALAKVAQAPFSFIEFDDGTTGWIYGGPSPERGFASISYNSGSTPDEYVAGFTPTFKAEVDAIGTNVSDIDATNDTFEVRLYSDPFGTPALVTTVTPDPDQTASATAATTFALFACTPSTLTAGVGYGIAIRPTSANSISIGYIDLLTGNEKIKRMSIYGSTQKFGSRTDTTGAFTEVQTYNLPYVWLRFSKLDDGAGHVIGGNLLHLSPEAPWHQKGPKEWIAVH